MTRISMIEAIADTLVASKGHPLGIAGIMLDNEYAAGAVSYPTDPADWVQPAVVVRRGDDVRIVAVLARHPGSGALGRLITRIKSEGLRPVIVEPVGTVMPAILKRYGWKRRVIGRGFERTEEWSPRP